jgi:tetratricopeptide (TPR) repeat protein
MESGGSGFATVEFLWVEYSEKAAREIVRGRVIGAAGQSYEMTRDFQPDDPRLASSLNNLAIVHRIHGDLQKAERLYGRAREVWKTSSRWVEEMCLGQRARSSLFHLRLEQKHREHYDRVAREKHRRVLSAGYAATLNNLAELSHTIGRVEDAEKLYRHALGERIHSVGEKESGAVAIRDNLAALSGMSGSRTAPMVTTFQEAGNVDVFNSRAAERGWVLDHPPEFTDEGRLMAAVLFTGLINHLRLCEANVPGP